ncbi:MAG TPA: galactose-1-phosphate uridylyltransferase [Vicinamibacterales bacterium]|nr:galactose-1-phosphate uridylyltransferase [Vicinamibacterales bacterium]
MPDLRRDPVSGRWVIISTDRAKRPHDFQVTHVHPIGREHCPFCPGHEAMTPPEILAYRNGSSPNAPGWDVRVVPNKYPALKVEGALDRQGDGLFDRMNGVGAHEVIIETPDHTQTLATLGEGPIERVLSAWRDRIRDLKQDRRLRYILVFKNHGAAAGATVEHTHSQLIALPLVPDFVREEIEGARRHYAEKERCLFCDIVRQEIEEGRRVVQESADIVALAPYAPRFPFETWLVPKRHGARFEEASAAEYESLARMLKAVLTRMDRALEYPPFNLVLHTAPFTDEAVDSYHWHLEILPKVARMAGFEWGTGFYINPTSPEEATEVLRAIQL